MFKLSKLESKYPCKCGHQERRHGKLEGRVICWQCFEVWLKNKSKSMKYSAAHEYTADNLRFLEQKLAAKERSKTKLAKKDS